MKNFKEAVNSNGRAFGVPTRHASKLQRLKVLHEKIMKASNAAKKVLSYPVISKEKDWIVYDLWKVPYLVPRVIIVPLNKEERIISGTFWAGIVGFGLLNYGGEYIYNKSPKTAAALAIPGLILLLFSGGAVFGAISNDVDYIIKKFESKYKGGNIE